MSNSYIELSVNVKFIELLINVEFIYRIINQCGIHIENYWQMWNSNRTKLMNKI